uniref:Uncharacterized protein n=1 Tax=Syphacia muris TaxID=451379 RepID=A0A0N5ADK7_9BILA
MSKWNQQRKYRSKKETDPPACTRTVAKDKVKRIRLSSPAAVSGQSVNRSATGDRHIAHRSVHIDSNLLLLLLLLNFCNTKLWSDKEEDEQKQQLVELQKKKKLHIDCTKNCCDL